jgi:DNA (cytosine-5)-methyltransferase 1
VTVADVQLSAVDLFCGAGGLSLGLKRAKVKVVAGFDIDARCKYPFRSNIRAKFFEQDVRTVTGDQLIRLWVPGSVRVLAGCAPCQPFSSHRRGADTSKDDAWPLLDEFGRLVKETKPELVTMENVPRILKAAVFHRFIKTLLDLEYAVDYRSRLCAEYGLPQMRRRLVLVASRIGPIEIPAPTRNPGEFATVSGAIRGLPSLKNGQSDSADPLHASRTLSSTNLLRIQASKPGGTWRDWPEELRAPCHQKETGSSFASVYARMEWDKPSPTITTEFHNFGSGRFGHPEQDRALTLREGAILQGFPPSYKFVSPGDKVELEPMARLIGNAVPPPVGEAIGRTLVECAARHASEG